MNNWQEFLIQHGATISAGLTTSFGESSADYPGLSATMSDLSNQGVILLEGPDSETFLQGQSTADMRLLDEHTILPGAICSPKGRMLCSFYALKPEADKILLVMDNTLIAPMLSTLSKYAAFFKTTLSDASTQSRHFGISGPECEQALKQHFDNIPEHDNQIVFEKDSSLLRLAPQQFMLIIKPESAEQTWLSLTTHFKAVGIDYWQLQTINAGLAQVQAETAEQFVPQMFNLQATGGISFKKGCYTGQEIVARMQYLGKLKRRTYHLVIESQTLPAIGSKLTQEDGKVAGEVILAAHQNSTHIALLAVLQELAPGTNTLSIDGEKANIEIIELPYQLSADTASKAP